MRDLHDHDAVICVKMRPEEIPDLNGCLVHVYEPYGFKRSYTAGISKILPKRFVVASRLPEIIADEINCHLSFLRRRLFDQKPLRSTASSELAPNENTDIISHFLALDPEGRTRAHWRCQVHRDLLAARTHGYAVVVW